MTIKCRWSDCIIIVHAVCSIFLVFCLVYSGTLNVVIVLFFVHCFDRWHLINSNEVFCYVLYMLKKPNSMRCWLDPCKLKFALFDIPYKVLKKLYIMHGGKFDWPFRLLSLNPRQIDRRYVHRIENKINGFPFNINQMHTINIHVMGILVRAPKTVNFLNLH